MKKILFLILIFYPFVLFSQPASGDGSAGNPFSGVITTPWTLSGDNYCSDLSLSSGTFTINPGAILRFGSGNSLTISGSGVLSAVGNSSGYITFTAAGTSWGHITFSDPASTGSSSLDYTIVEFGSVSGSGYAGTGGGILIRHNNVTVSHSIIRNNSSDWGGGIFIDNSKSPHINNCLFKDNTTIHGGGAIYCWVGVSSVIENCVFDSNHCTEPSTSYYSGGAVTAQTAAPIQVLNCTFVNNTSTQPGDALLIQYSPGALIENCILWGSTNQISLATASQVVNCAIEGSAGYTNTVTLTHSGVTGPNFTATDGSDWSIQYVSPCRDAGTTPSPPVPFDYNGKPRVGNYDIGAYEVQYSKWNGTANDNLWSTQSNWDGNVDPSTGTDYIIIPSGLTHYPTGSSPDFTLGSGKIMILQSGAQATFGALTNNGTFKLQCNATDMSSLICSSVTGSGTDSIELYLSGGGAPNYKWHYISKPISYLNVSTFAPSYTNNIAGWYDNLISGTLVSGWVAFDGYVYVTKTVSGPTFDNFVTGIGYDYYAIADRKYTISGQINTSDVTLSLSYAVDDALHGFNLLGNPFPSGLNWDDIANSVYYAFPANTSKTIYFTRDNAQCSYVGGVGVPGDVTGIIPPMQGFFVKTNSTGNSITLAAGARSQGTIHARYKGSSVIPLVRLSLTEGSLSDETVVRFDPLAKTNLDYDFDALKMFVSTTSTQIYSAFGGTDYSINGQPFPDTLIEIPIVVNLTIDGNHNITVPQLQGLDNYDVTLTDKTTGFTANLKTTPTLSFSASAGTIADRFVLKISKIVTGIENPVVSKNTFNIYPANSMINIQTLSDVWEGKSGSVKVMDLTGKTVGDLNNAEFNKNSLVQVAAPGAKGIYMVEVKSGYMRYVGKVVIR